MDFSARDSHAEWLKRGTEFIDMTVYQNVVHGNGPQYVSMYLSVHSVTFTLLI